MHSTQTAPTQMCYVTRRSGTVCTVYIHQECWQFQRGLQLPATIRIRQPRTKKDPAAETPSADLIWCAQGPGRHDPMQAENKVLTYRLYSVPA